MPHITIRLTNDLNTRMGYRAIDWDEIARKAFEEALASKVTLEECKRNVKLGIVKNGKKIADYKAAQINKAAKILLREINHGQ